MITNADIIIFNGFYSSDRREMYIATRISNVCWYEAHSLVQNTKSRTNSARYMIRIPIDATVEGGRKYIEEYEYRKLTDEERKDYWTIQQDQSLVAMLKPGQETEFECNEEYGYPDIQTSGMKIVTVREWADNTTRGRKASKHWRIGGA